MDEILNSWCMTMQVRFTMNRQLFDAEDSFYLWRRKYYHEILQENRFFWYCASEVYCYYLFDWKKVAAKSHGTCMKVLSLSFGLVLSSHLKLMNMWTSMLYWYKNYFIMIVPSKHLSFLNPTCLLNGVEKICWTILNGLTALALARPHWTSHLLVSEPDTNCLMGEVDGHW